MMIVTFVSILASLISCYAANNTIVECTVHTIAGKDVQKDFLCTDKFLTYKIRGDVESFYGSSYTSSQTTFTFPAFIASPNKVLDIEKDEVRSFISFTNPKSKSLANRLDIIKEGTHKALIIKVVDNTGDGPTESETRLANVFFNKNNNFGNSVQSVFLGCSNNKFKLIPATGSAVNDGVITINLDFKVAGMEYYDVSDSAEALLPLSSIDDYTYTMFILPSSAIDAPGRGQWPGTVSWYETGSVKKIYIGLHEVGHNLYLDHSGADDDLNGVFDDDEEYDDPSCQMGGEWGTIYDGEKCFNAAKTYELGWYSEYNGITNPTSSAFRGSLVGINDVVNDEVSSDQFVAVKIADSGETNLFMMYNRVEGVNKFLEIQYYRDKVVVVKQRKDGRQSWVMAVLDKGDTYTKNNWAGSGNALKIKVCDMTSGSPDIAEVGVWLNGVNSVSCEAAPTVSPAPTTALKEIIYAANPCTWSFPETEKCEECTGDCDYDSDCEGDLRCFQREGGEDVPGCYFSNSRLKSFDDDYCYDPNALEGIVQYVDECNGRNPCKRCQGDCDGDSDCADGLKCFQRDGFEAVPGCSGEGGIYDREAKDMCYSTSPTPTAPTPTPPPPTPSSSCADSPFRFKIRKDGRNISRDCTWVANRATSSRCKLVGVMEQCPFTCDTCSSCVDSTARFKFAYNGRMITRDCTWVKNRNTQGRCKITGMSDTCRSTCETC